MPLRAVIFDQDGTLADSVHLVCVALSLVYQRWAGKVCTEEEILAGFGPPDDELIRRAVPAAVAESALADYYRIYETEHDRFVQDTMGMLETLQQCREWGLAVGVFTGKGRRTASLTLARLGMTDLVDVFLSGNDILPPKPSPEGILRAAAALGVPPGETAYVGDTAVDLAAAKAAGARPVMAAWYPLPGEEPESELAEIVCRTPLEFLAWVDRERVGGSTT